MRLFKKKGYWEALPPRPNDTRAFRLFDNNGKHLTTVHKADDISTFHYFLKSLNNVAYDGQHNSSNYDGAFNAMKAAARYFNINAFWS